MAICVGCGSTVTEPAAFCLNCGRAQADPTVTPTPTDKTLMWIGQAAAEPQAVEPEAVLLVEPAGPTPYVAPLAPSEQLSERTSQMPAVTPIVVPRPDRRARRVAMPVEPASIPSLAVDVKAIAGREAPHWESPTFFQRLVAGRRRPTPVGRLAGVGFAFGLILLGASLIPVGGRLLWERLSPLEMNVVLIDLIPGLLAIFHLATPTLSLSVRVRAFTHILTAALILVPRAILAPPLFAPDLAGVQVFVSLYMPPLLAACLWWRSRAFEDILPRVVCSIACVAALALILLPFGEGRPSLVSTAIETIRRAQLPDLRAFAVPTIVYGLSAALGITATLMRSKGIAGIWAFVVVVTFTVWLALIAHAVASGVSGGAQLDAVAAFTLHGVGSYFALVGLVFLLAPEAHDS